MCTLCNVTPLRYVGQAATLASNRLEGGERGLDRGAAVTEPRAFPMLQRGNKLIFLFCQLWINSYTLRNHYLPLRSFNTTSRNNTRFSDRS